MVWRRPSCCLLLVLVPAQPLLAPPFPHRPLYPQLRLHPQLCAPASASGASVGRRRRNGGKKPGSQAGGQTDGNGGKKPGKRPGKAPSFATRLQRAKTAEDGLELLSGAPDTSGTVAALQRLALLCPRSSAEAEAAWALRHDARLATAVAALASASPQLGVVPRCTALWSVGMCWDPTAPHSSRLRTAAAALAEPLEVSSLGAFRLMVGTQPSRPSDSADRSPSLTRIPPLSRRPPIWCTRSRRTRRRRQRGRAKS